MHDSLQFFYSVQKENLHKKIKENRMNFEGAYLSDGWADSTQIWNRRCPTLMEFPQQNWLISVQALLSYECVKQHFLGSCKMHTCLSRVCISCAWPHDTLSCVLVTSLLYEKSLIFHVQTFATFFCVILLSKFLQYNNSTE